MWDHYRKTLTRVQSIIVLATAAVYLGLGHRWFMSIVFFAFMQLGSVVGAWWGQRLKGRFQT